MDADRMLPATRRELPSVGEILQAAELLQFPVDPTRLGLSDMPEDRQVTVLLAAMSSWVTACRVVQDVHVDRPSFHHMQALTDRAEREVLDGMPESEAVGAALTGAIWRLQEACFAVERVAEGPHPTNPVVAIRGLIRAAIWATTFLQRQTDDSALATLYHLGRSTAVDSLLARARSDALSAVVDLGPPQNTVSADAEGNVPATLLEQAVGLMGSIYDSDPCVRDEDGDCTAHKMMLDPEDPCPMKLVQEFLRVQKPRWSPNSRVD